MNYVEFTNKGEVDVNAFTLIGATNKRGSDKIGYFGSGNKYAIATFLRNKIDVKIFSGLEEIKITKQKQEFRGQNFDMIKFNGQKTSLTTDMGIDWKLWFAIREIYCNALDEGGFEMNVKNIFEPEKEKTKFYIELTKEVNEIFLNWNNYFSDRRTDIIFDDSKFQRTKMFQGGGKTIIYRKGINVGEKEMNCLFNYDFEDIEINESRVCSEWDFNGKPAWEIQNTSSFEIINTFVHNWKHTFEGNISWQWYGGKGFSQEWLKVIRKKKLIPENYAGYFLEEQAYKNSIILPDELCKKLKDFFREGITVLGIGDKDQIRIELPLGQKEKKLLDECVSFLDGEISFTGINIKMTDFNDNGITLGEARNGEIFLDAGLFSQGRKQIVCTLVEEYSHIRSQADDKTRAFQDFLINKYVESIENKNKIYL